MKIETVTVHKVDAWDVESFVQDTYGVQISIAAAEEAADDQVFEFNVNGEVDEWDQEKVDNILAGGWENFSTSAILNYMAKGSLIPTGTYLVTCVS